jgi:hypothetical protein
LLQKPADLARGIIEITENPGSGGANLHASRFQAAFNPVAAKVTLVSNMLGGMAVTGAVGTGWNTIPTVDADLAVYQHQAVIGLESSSRNRAGRYTGRFIALHAIAGLKMQLAAGSVFRLYPVSIGVGRDLILQLAGNDTSLTVKTLGGIYHHGVFGLHIDVLIFGRSTQVAFIAKFLRRLLPRQFPLRKCRNHPLGLRKTSRKMWAPVHAGVAVHLPFPAKISLPLCA